MKKSNRKGFTIVELVIVIAVIAILAAVLIPTFTNLIKKANESSDMQAVRQMNTILAAENAFLGGITINDAVAALQEAGFNGDKYVPLVAGTYFFYDQNTKQIVYVDGEYNVIYPKGADIEGHALFSLSGDTPKEDYPTPVIEGNTATFTISTAEQFAQLAADFKALADGEQPAGLAGFTREVLVNDIATVTSKNIVINLEADIDLRGASFNLNLLDVDFTLNGNNHTISGVVNNSGFAVSDDNAEKQASQYGAGFLGYVTNSNIAFNNVTFKNCHFGNADVKGSAVFVGQLNNTSSLTLNTTTVEDCTVGGKYGVAVYVGHVYMDNVTGENVGKVKHPQAITFEGTNTVSGCELTATDDRVATIVGRFSPNNTGSLSVSGTAPTFSVTIISAGVAVDATERDIINGSDKGSPAVAYTGSWTK